MGKTACLSGQDIAALLEGKKVPVGDVDFVYDGLGVREIEASLDNLKKAKGHRPGSTTVKKS